MTKINKGFASNPVIHQFLSSKGGRVRTPKGLAKLDPERRREIASMGGKQKNENNSNRRASQSSEENTSIADLDLARVLGDLGE